MKNQYITLRVLTSFDLKDRKIQDEFLRLLNGYPTEILKNDHILEVEVVES